MEKYFDINEQGYSIRCKLYAKDPKAIRRVVIFAHGFGSHKDNHAAARFAEQTTAKYKDTAVITFDWPCHGQDARTKLVLKECLTYYGLVLGYVKKTWTENQIYCYAASFGGYLTLRYLSEQGNPFRKIALRSPAVDMYRAIMQVASEEDRLRLEKGKDAILGFDRKIKVSPAFVEELKNASVAELEFFDYADDLLIFHGTEDEMIPFESIRDFAENNVIEFIPVEKTGHRFRNPQKLDQLHQTILQFFAL